MLAHFTGSRSAGMVDLASGRRWRFKTSELDVEVPWAGAGYRPGSMLLAALADWNGAGDRAGAVASVGLVFLFLYMQPFRSVTYC